MIKVQNWIGRSFNFGFSAGVFPSILERVKGTPARLEELLKNISPDILTKRINRGWSIQEHAGHLLDLEELNENRLKDFLSGKDKLSPADMSNEKTNDANHNSKSINVILKNFRKERSLFVGKLENLSEEDVLKTALHPRLNKMMTIIDWLFFIAEHDDHHLAKINEIWRENL